LLQIPIPQLKPSFFQSPSVTKT